VNFSFSEVVNFVAESKAPKRVESEVSEVTQQHLVSASAAPLFWGLKMCIVGCVKFQFFFVYVKYLFADRERAIAC
jgi:hypothetical protein